ncbi:25613_t:CDS:2, partial [Dentiscutata erythropus]
ESKLCLIIEYSLSGIDGKGRLDFTIKQEAKALNVESTDFVQIQSACEKKRRIKFFGEQANSSIKCDLTKLKSILVNYIEK